MIWTSAQTADNLTWWRLAIFTTTDGVRELVDVLTADSPEHDWRALPALDRALVDGGYARAADWEHGSSSGFVARLERAA